jgi:hypothetical protein
MHQRGIIKQTRAYLFLFGASMHLIGAILGCGVLFWVFM